MNTRKYGLLTALMSVVAEQSKAIVVDDIKDESVLPELRARGVEITDGHYIDLSHPVPSPIPDVYAHQKRYGVGYDISYRVETISPQKHYVKPNGMRKWEINGVTVYAATKKTAYKKAEKLINQPKN